MNSTIIVGVRFRKDGKVYEYSVEPGKTFVPETLLHILELASKERELVGEVFLTKETVNVWVNSIFDDPAELVLIAFVSPDEGKFRPIKALGGQADSDWEALKKEVSFNRIFSSLLEIEASRTKSKEKKENVNMKTELTSVKEKGVFGNIGKKIAGIFGISMMGGQPAVKLGSKWVVYDKKAEILHDVSDFVLEFDMFPGITMPVPIANLVEGDLVMVNDELGFVVSTSKGKFDIITGNGEVKTIMGLTHFLMGQSAFAVKVMNPMSGMNMQGGQGDLGFNPMMFMLMGKDSGSDSNSMLESMMMMNMMNGQGNIFGASTQFQEAEDKKGK